MENKAQTEVNRITSLLKEFNVSDKRIKLLKPVIENVAIMKTKLDETKELMEESSVVISYDNGGGQKGIRENPIFKGYESLWKSYMAGMDRIFNVLPNENVSVPEVEELKPQTVLELVRNKKQKQA